MKKKQISIIVLSVFLFIGVTGCTDWLNVKPESEIILDEYWKSESDVESVLMSCYRGLTEDACIYRMMVWGELRSDNIIPGSGFPTARYDMQRILEGELTSVNAYSSWGSFYSVINYCNTLLFYAPKVLDRDRNFSVDDLKKVRAEALTIRALCYFYLVRSFHEVPWVDVASIDDAQDYSPAKSSERAVLDSIISNLKEAQLNARTDFGQNSKNKGRITMNAVNSLLADVYLWDQQYSKCVETCDLVLADKKLKLIEQPLTYSNVFYLGKSAETIFELQFDENIQKNNAVINLYGNDADPYGEFGFPSTLAFDPETKIAGAYSPFAYKVTTNFSESTNDVRTKDSYRLFGGKYFVFKYAGMARYENLTTLTSTYRYRTQTANWIIYRLSDLMLMKAEALVELDGTANNKNALTLVSKTYLRSNLGEDSLKIANYPSKVDMEKLVLRERQRELLFEGKRWFDLVRMAKRENSTSTLNDYVNRKVTGNGASLGASVMDAMYLPISRSELEANPNLVQNPYYGENANSSSR